MIKTSPSSQSIPAAPPSARAIGNEYDFFRVVQEYLDKAAKTITVRIDTSRRHRRYQKIVRSSKTLHAHDENNDAHEGDLVLLIETRPLSATKRWRLAEVLERVR